jgi:hypothetical protein
VPKHPFPTYDSICHIASSSHYISRDIMNVSQQTPFSVRQGTPTADRYRPVAAFLRVSVPAKEEHNSSRPRSCLYRVLRTQYHIDSTEQTTPHSVRRRSVPAHSCEGGLRPARHLALRAGWVVKRVQTRVHHLQIPPCDMRQTSPWLDGAAMPKLESCGLPLLAWALTRSCTTAAAVLLAQHLMLRTA